MINYCATINRTAALSLLQKRHKDYTLTVCLSSRDCGLEESLVVANVGRQAFIQVDGAKNLIVQQLDEIQIN